MVSGFDLFFALFNNIAIFITLISLYGYLYKFSESLNPYIKNIITGFSFGIFAVGCMYAKIPVYAGVFVDQRNAVITLSAAFGGPLSGLISAVVAGLFRFYRGGEGVFAGIAGIFLAAAAGSILYFWKNSFSKISTAAIRSLISTLIFIPGFLFIGDLKAGWNLMMDMLIPYGSAIFMGILLGGLLIRRQEIQSTIKKELKISEEKYRVLFESFPLGIIITDKIGKIIETNDVADKIAGISNKDHHHRTIDSPDWDILRPDGEPMAPADYPGMIAIKENRKIENIEMGVVLSDGKKNWLNVTVTPIPLQGYGVAIIYNDISDRKKFQRNLEKALNEKTILLQELYHRTKNNMQMIISLLELQSSIIKDKKFKMIIEETQNKIHSMALVHEKLYQSRDLLNISLSEYIRDLVSLLVYSFQVDDNQVSIAYSMVDDVFIKIDTAIPIGLLLQELISNVFKHAFPEGKKGTLIIKLTKSADNTISLSVADDGVGLPPSMDIRKEGKFGISTVLALGEKQLYGNLKFDTSNGMKCSLTFKNDILIKRISH